MDRMANKYLVYSFYEQGGYGTKKSSFEFKLQFELSSAGSFLFKYMLLNNIDPHEYYKKHSHLIKLDNKGLVKMCYCENIGVMEPDSENGLDASGSDFMQIRLVGGIFS